MSEVNSNNYEGFTGSFVPVRDINNNLLSITSSTVPINDESQFIEQDSSRVYYSSSSLNQIVDTNFSELTITDEGQFTIPSGSFIANESDYQWLLDRILNLEEDLISTESLFQSEIEILTSENTALERTVQSVAGAALNITNELISRYEATQSVANDLGAFRYLWNTPFNDIITNRNGNLTGSHHEYLDISQSGATGLGQIPTTIHRTEVSYSLAYDGNYLVDLFTNYEWGTLTIAALQGKIIELHAVTKSMQDQIISLENQLYICRNSGGTSGTSGGGGTLGQLSIHIQTPDLNNVVETYKDFEIRFKTDDGPSSQYNYVDWMYEHATGGFMNTRHVQYINSSTITFWKDVEYTYYKSDGDPLIGHRWDPWVLEAQDVTSLQVKIAGVLQQPFIINNENLSNLSFPVKAGQTTNVYIVADKRAWGLRA